MTLREFWIRITSTRYTRALEAEVLLLRAENRALLNSILGIAGVPPVPALAGEPPIANTWSEAERVAVSEAAKNKIKPGTRRCGNPGPAANMAAGNGAGLKLAAPLRRRSWQQINRMLEIESGLKKREA
jgi:hypothetical protein